MWHVVNNEHHVFGKISIFTTRSDLAVIRVMHGPWSTLLYWMTGNASSWHQLFCKFNPTKSAKKERKKEESRSLGTGGMIGVWMSLSRALLSPHETQWIVLPWIISIQAILIAWELLGPSVNITPSRPGLFLSAWPKTLERGNVQHCH